MRKRPKPNPMTALSFSKPPRLSANPMVALSLSKPPKKYSNAQRLYDQLHEDRPNPSLSSAIVDPTSGCCVDEVTGTIWCPGGSAQWYMHGRVVPQVALSCYDDPQSGRVCVVSTGDSTATLAVCPSRQDPTCCVDTTNMVVVCEDENSDLYGAPVLSISVQHPDGLLTFSFLDADGMTRSARLYPCPPPQQCCYDPAAGVLRCDRQDTGISVSLVAMAPNENGSLMVMIKGEGLPKEHEHVPVCDDQVINCCYDATNEKLSCPGSDLDGIPAALLAAWSDANGNVYVWASWNGGAARMPLCPGQTECPPVFCCVNVQSMTYVCPGRPELNGTKAEISDIVTEGGYSWGVLTDGSRIPLCGEDCPPPKICPECPTCPRGLWMSPDGTCVEIKDIPESCPTTPKCPSCPHGMLLDTHTGRCVPVLEIPPVESCPLWWEVAGSCCESCALDKPCVGSEGGCGCDEKRGGHGGAWHNPGPKRRILSGSRMKNPGPPAYSVVPQAAGLSCPDGYQLHCWTTPAGTKQCTCIKCQTQNGGAVCDFVTPQSSAVTASMKARTVR